MIQKTIAFETTDKQTFGTVELARQHELELLLGKKFSGVTTASMSEISSFINDNSESIVDILTMKATSRPKARKKNRTPKPELTATTSSK